MIKIKPVSFFLFLLIFIFSCEDTIDNANPDESLMWEHIEFEGIRVTAIGFNSDSDIFIGTSTDNSAIYKSSDDGESWSEILSNTGWVKSIIVNSSDEIIVHSANTFLSIDNGSTWETRSTPYGSPQVMSINDEDVLFCGGWIDNYLAFTSHNNAESWENISAGLPPTSLSFYAITYDTLGNIYYGSVAVNSIPVGVFRYSHDQATWEHAGLDTLSIKTLTTSLSGVIFAGTTNGVYRSVDNGNTWEKAGLVGKNIEELASNEYGDLFAGIFYGDGVFVSNDNGHNWDQVNSGLKIPIAVRSLAIDSENRVYLGTYYDGLYRGIYTH